MGLGFWGVRIWDIALTRVPFLDCLADFSLKLCPLYYFLAFSLTIRPFLLFSCIFTFIAGDLLPLHDQKEARIMVEIFLMMSLTLGRIGLGRLKINGLDGLDLFLTRGKWTWVDWVWSGPGWMSFPKPQRALSLGAEL